MVIIIKESFHVSKCSSSVIFCFSYFQSIFNFKFITIITQTIRCHILQRLGALKTDASTDIEVTTAQPVDEKPKESSNMQDIQTETKVLEDTENKADDKKEEKVEESLTPPLLPNMIVKPSDKTETTAADKKLDKAKKNQWDMFAEQDIFKADTDVI